MKRVFTHQNMRLTRIAMLLLLIATATLTMSSACSRDDDDSPNTTNNNNNHQTIEVDGVQRKITYSYIRYSEDSDMDDKYVMISIRYEIPGQYNNDGEHYLDINSFHFGHEPQVGDELIMNDSELLDYRGGYCVIREGSIKVLDIYVNGRTRMMKLKFTDVHSVTHTFNGTLECTYDIKVY